MLRQFILCVVALIALGCGAAAPAERDLINPYWLERPTQDEIWKALVAQGHAYEAYSGSVSMLCSVTAGGRLDACTVPDADTRHQGLKKAALSLAPLFETKRQDSVGEEVSGTRTLITLNFLGPPANNEIESGLHSRDAAADIDCAVAALRHWAEDGETVEPATPSLSYAYVPPAEWAVQRRLLQTQQQVRDTEVWAFYAGRLTVHAPKVDLRSAVFEANRDGAGTATNDATFAGCEARMMALRHIPSPPPMPIIP